MSDYEREAAGKVWRPLLNGEYPPPGPMKLGGSPLDKVQPILVFAAPLAAVPTDRADG